MHKNKSSEALSQEAMQRLTLTHIQAYVNACHCQTRSDVLLALEHWQHAGAELAEFIKTTRIIVIDEQGHHEF